jgi:ParB family chromosome partitioning protein
MFIDIDKIKVSSRIRKDFGDINELAEDIKKNGLINPPAINKEYQLLAGERRLRACKLLGWKQIPVNMIDTDGEEQDLSIEISENEARKEFTMTERLAYARKLTEIESAKAKQRSLSNLNHLNVECPNLGSRERTGDAVGKAVGMGRENLRKAQIIEDNKNIIDAEDFKNWDDGKLSTNKLYNQLKAKLAEAEKELEERPEKIVKVEDEEDKKEIERLKRHVEGRDRDYRFIYNEREEILGKNHELEKKMAEMKKQHEKEIKQLTGDHETYVKKSAINLIAGIQSFLSTYGGDIWLTDKTVVDEMKENERKLLISAANALIGFAYQMKENLGGNEYE